MFSQNITEIKRRGSHISINTVIIWTKIVVIARN